MNIGFVYHSDSHFKAVYQTALRLRKQYEFEPYFYAVNSDYKLNNQFNCHFIDDSDLSDLVRFDYLICCLGGYLLNKVVNKTRYTNTKVISLFPGVVSHYQLDSFISRFNADQVWLNSRADYKLYGVICKLFGTENNGILYGMPWLKLEVTTEKSFGKSTLEQKKAVFFEQTLLLDNEFKQKYYVHLMDRLFCNNTNVQFLYKIRDNTQDVFFEKVRIMFEKYPNVSVKSKLDYSDNLTSSYFLTLSSSAIIDGLLSNKDCYLIDKQLLDEDAMEIFNGCGLFIDSKMLLGSKMNMNQSWFNHRLLAPKQQIDLSFVAKKHSFFATKSRHIIFIRGLLLKLSLFNNKKFMRPLFDKKRMYSIQKSLEYIDLDLKNG